MRSIRTKTLLMRSAVAPVLEAMEGRRLLSVSLDDGALSVVGTSRADSITIGLRASDPSKLSVRLNGAVSEFALADVTSIDVQARSGSDRVVVDLGASPAAGVRVNGGNGNDWLRGSAGDDTLLGGHGKDLIMGEGGDDLIEGGMQADRLLGGAGDDTIRGGHGHDLINSGDGDDLTDGGRGDNDVDSGDAALFTPANAAASQAAANGPMARPADTGYSAQQMRKAYGFG